MTVKSKVLRCKISEGRQFWAMPMSKLLEACSGGEGRSLMPSLPCCVSLALSVKVPRVMWVERSIMSEASKTSMNETQV